MRRILPQPLGDHQVNAWTNNGFAAVRPSNRDLAAGDDFEELGLLIFAHFSRIPCHRPYESTATNDHRSRAVDGVCNSGVGCHHTARDAHLGGG